MKIVEELKMTEVGVLWSGQDRERHEKRVLRVAHTRNPFAGEYPPPEIIGDRIIFKVRGTNLKAWCIGAD